MGTLEVVIPPDILNDNESTEGAGVAVEGAQYGSGAMQLEFLNRLSSGDGKAPETLSCGMMDVKKEVSI